MFGNEVEKKRECFLFLPWTKRGVIPNEGSAVWYVVRTGSCFQSFSLCIASISREAFDWKILGTSSLWCWFHFPRFRFKTNKQTNKSIEPVINTPQGLIPYLQTFVRPVSWYPLHSSVCTLFSVSCCIVFFCITLELDFSRQFSLVNSQVLIYTCTFRFFRIFRNYRILFRAISRDHFC